MQKVFVMNFEDKKQADEFIDEVFSNRGAGITVEVFNTPLEAFAGQEGPYRINELIEEGELEKLDNEEILKKMGREAAQVISDNLHGESCEYGDILDGGELSRIATDSAIKVFRECLKDLNEHDREIAEQYIEYWG